MRHLLSPCICCFFALLPVLPLTELSNFRSRSKIIYTLLAAQGRRWEQMRDLLPAGQSDGQQWTSSASELRSSPLGQALLTVADSATRGIISSEKVQRAMMRIALMLYGDPLGDGYTLPADFHKTDLGKLFQAATVHLYHADDLLTAVQAYTMVGIKRQTLYDRLHRGKLTAIYRGGDLRFLRSEIETWKAQHDQRENISLQEK